MMLTEQSPIEMKKIPSLESSPYLKITTSGVEYRVLNFKTKSSIISSLDDFVKISYGFKKY